MFIPIIHCRDAIIIIKPGSLQLKQPSMWMIFRESLQKTEAELDPVNYGVNEEVIVKGEWD